MMTRRKVLGWLGLFFGGPVFVAGCDWLALHPEIANVVWAVLLATLAVVLWGLACAAIVSGFE